MPKTSCSKVFWHCFWIVNGHLKLQAFCLKITERKTSCYQIKLLGLYIMSSLFCLPFPPHSSYHFESPNTLHGQLSVLVHPHTVTLVSHGYNILLLWRYKLVYQPHWCQREGRTRGHYTHHLGLRIDDPYHNILPSHHAMLLKGTARGYVNMIYYIGSMAISTGTPWFLFTVHLIKLKHQQLGAVPAQPSGYGL